METLAYILFVIGVISFCITALVILFGLIPELIKEIFRK